MPSKASVYRQILREYDSIRAQKNQELRQKQSKVYSKCPKIEALEKEMSLTGVKIARLVLKNPSNAIDLAADLKEELSVLNKKKSALLAENGFPEGYLTLRYECEKCHDTGFVLEKKCSCLQQKLVNNAYGQSNLKDITQLENFDYFDFRFYSEEFNTKEGNSPLKNIKEIYNICMKFVQSFDNDFSNLLLYGNTGLGKTFLCNCIAKDLLDNGKTVLYMTAAQLFKLIEEHRFHKTDEDEYTDYMEDILSMDLFIIDDLGTEFSTILSSSELFHIINTRLLEKRPVILSTNLSPAKLMEQYSDRIVSRIIGNYRTLKFFGDDIRIKKKFKS